MIAFTSVLSLSHRTYFQNYLKVCPLLPYIFYTSSVHEHSQACEEEMLIAHKAMS
jgi:hypothetical protein